MTAKRLVRTAGRRWATGSMMSCAAWHKRLRLIFLGLVLASLSQEVTADGQVREPDGVKDRNALWKKLGQVCAPAAASRVHPPSPCIVVPGDGALGGYAILKDQKGRYQYLVIPLDRISGVEDPALQKDRAPNYFARAWDAKRYVEAALHGPRPRDQLMLAVNSRYGRSQDQLHIHIDCVRTDVHEVLERLLPTIGIQWQKLAQPLPPFGHAYDARWVGGESLSVDPFKSLAAALPAGDAMGRHGLAVVGARAPDGRPGFILLSIKASLDQGNRGSAEELEDHQCAIAGEPHRTDTAISFPTRHHESPHETVSNKEAILLGPP
jgi:CDP-diacylglycerol pyrophosphatase